MTLGQRIQELRKKAGLTQEQLAERLGVTRQAVSKWESDNGVPELDTLIAMSRLFGVTIGQLLGVEGSQGDREPAWDGGQRPEGARLDEEQMEALLRRYVEAARAQRQPSGGMYGRWGWKAPLIAVAGLAAIVLVLGLRMANLDNTISNLYHRISYLENNYDNLTGSLSSLEDRLQDDLAQLAIPFHQFDWQVEHLDLEGKAVDLSWRLSLKEYDTGTQVQLALRGEDGAQYTSDWATAPEFEGWITQVPLDSYTCSIRIMGQDGTVQEYEADPVALAPEDFQLWADSLSALYSIQMGSTATAVSGDPAVRIISPFPELFQPTWAELTVTLNGEVLETISLTLAEEGNGVWYGRDSQGARQLRLEEGDRLDFTLEVEDSLGRQYEFQEQAGENGSAPSPGMPVVNS